jgi:hypothetical protein
MEARKKNQDRHSGQENQIKNQNKQQQQKKKKKNSIDFPGM